MASEPVLDPTRTRAPGAVAAATPRGAHRLADRLADLLAARIDHHALRPGTRMPSIRTCAAEQRVSRSTVVEAYERLVDSGRIEARRGSGFYVCRLPASRPATADSGGGPAERASIGGAAIDVVWLMRSMLRQAPAGDQPGAGTLPARWLDGDLVAAAVRAVGRTGGGGLLGYGQAAGYLPLRQHLAEWIARLGIVAAPGQIVTTTGVTQALDLVLRRFTRPGDVVMVEDPAWFLLFARAAAFGLRLVGVPRRADGPDLEAVAALAEAHRPRLFILQSVLHNPTGSTMTPANAQRLLALAAARGLTLVEDDVYGDLDPAGRPRLAALDGLRHTIYLGGFAKTLAASLRVGYIVAEPALAESLADLKMLNTITSSELTERVVVRILAEGRYRRHLAQLRGRIDAARERTGEALAALGLGSFERPAAGMYLWVDCGRDTQALAAAAAREGLLLAPGSLFSPRQAPSTHLRVSAATGENWPEAPALRVLARLAGRPLRAGGV